MHRKNGIMLNSHIISSSVSFLTEKMPHVTLNVSFSELFKWHNSSDQVVNTICPRSLDPIYIGKPQKKFFFSGPTTKREGGGPIR